MVDGGRGRKESTGRRREMAMAQVVLMFQAGPGTTGTETQEDVA